jgi:uncharacterized RDD family membrane protein YckC
MSTFGEDPAQHPQGGELPSYPGETGMGPGVGDPYGAPYGTPYGAPQGGPPPGALAGFWIRFGSALIDGILLGVVASVLTFGGDAGTSTGLQFLLAGAYFIFLHSTKAGQSLGQRVCGIRLVDAKAGAQVTPASAAVRFLMSYVSGFALLLGYLWMLWDPMKQTWHDKVAGTLVVYSRVVPPPSTSLLER